MRLAKFTRMAFLHISLQSTCAVQLTVRFLDNFCISFMTRLCHSSKFSSFLSRDGLALFAYINSRSKQYSPFSLRGTRASIMSASTLNLLVFRITASFAVHTTVRDLSRRSPTDIRVLFNPSTCMAFWISRSPIFKVPESKHRETSLPAANCTVSAEPCL